MLSDSIKSTLCRTHVRGTWIEKNISKRHLSHRVVRRVYIVEFLFNVRLAIDRYLDILRFIETMKISIYSIRFNILLARLSFCIQFAARRIRRVLITSNYLPSSHSILLSLILF